MKLTNKELKEIKGGASISASLVNAILKGINSFMDVGRYLGVVLEELLVGTLAG